MKGRTRIAFFAVVALQVLFLVGLVAYKESTLRSGREVVLQALPVDPRDPFRGDFVILRYVISTLDTRAMASDGPFATGDIVYVRMQDRQPAADAVGVRRVPPQDWDLFIRGTVTGVRDGGLVLEVQYGIESYFVPEGKGLELQRAQDIKAVVAVDSSGRAILKRLIVDGEVFQTR
jgi:uncharacterized membrane-anchored protein